MNKNITFIFVVVVSFFLSISLRDWLWAEPAWYDYLSDLQSKNREWLVILPIWLSLTVGLYVALLLIGALRNKLGLRFFRQRG